MLLVSENQHFLTLFAASARPLLQFILTSKYFKMLRTEEAVEESVSNFYSLHHFPQCIGAIFELRVILVRHKFNCS